ncbi:MAG TPA: outer membrane protein assembly factor BamD [Terriglobia bacterium]|nr:outer membrane protein assembly factor BamD [Terriglobia bacterium]
MVQDNEIQWGKMGKRSLVEARSIKALVRRNLLRSGTEYRLFAIVLLTIAVTLFPSCLFRHHHNDVDSMLPSGQQPDKILFEKSIAEIDHGRFDVGRLTLQTLLNTYPDSEYLAKAKLAIANSYYQQGGASGLTESESEYKDFITFFPTAPEAPMAQFRVGMAHFRMMGKPDRDRTEAHLAEAEFKEFLLKYSDSPLMPRVKARLREVQEVLAEGEYSIARFYFEKRANPAARSRFQEIVDRYPNFSMADQACWYLAQTYQRMKNTKAAVPYYDRIITDYPLSSMAADAKHELATLHQPIPQPTLATLARARADATQDIHPGFFHKFTGVFSSAPNLQATRHGPVILTNQNSGTVMANNPQAGATAGSSIGVQPVGESALKNGKAVDPKGQESQPAAGSKETNPKEKTESDSGAQADVQTPQKKKKGPLHLFKKVIKPF